MKEFSKQHNYYTLYVFRPLETELQKFHTDDIALQRSPIGCSLILNLGTLKTTYQIHPDLYQASSSERNLLHSMSVKHQVDSSNPF